MLSSLKAQENCCQPKICRRPIWLPAEIWTDSFKMLSRRQLLANVQPVCARFHAICEQNVHCVHVIRNFGHFSYKLSRNLPEANRQYEDLAKNGTDLAKHIQLGGPILFPLTADLGNQANNKRYHRSQMCVLKHSIELFVGCYLHINFNNCQPEVLKEMLAYLDIFQAVQPAEITLSSDPADEIPLKFWHVDDMLKNLTILNCPRLTIRGNHKTSDTKMKPGAEAIANWLHYLPTNSDHLSHRIILVVSVLPSSFDELFELCKKNFFEALSPADRRPFTLRAKTSISLTDQRQQGHAAGTQPNYLHQSCHFHNDRTNEVLLVEPMITSQQQQRVIYEMRLRRGHANDARSHMEFLEFCEIPPKGFAAPPQVVLGCNRLCIQ